MRTTHTHLVSMGQQQSREASDKGNPRGEFHSNVDSHNVKPRNSNCEVVLHRNSSSQTTRAVFTCKTPPKDEFANEPVENDIENTEGLGNLRCPKCWGKAQIKGNCEACAVEGSRKSCSTAQEVDKGYKPRGIYWHESHDALHRCDRHHPNQSPR